MFKVLMTTAEMNGLYVENMKIRNPLKYYLYCNLVCKVLSQFILYPINNFFSQVPTFCAKTSLLPPHKGLLTHTVSQFSCWGRSRGRQQELGELGSLVTLPGPTVSQGQQLGPGFPPRLAHPVWRRALPRPCHHRRTITFFQDLRWTNYTFDKQTFLHVIKYSLDYYDIAHSYLISVHFFTVVYSSS